MSSCLVLFDSDGCTAVVPTTKVDIDARKGGHYEFMYRGKRHLVEVLELNDNSDHLDIFERAWQTSERASVLSMRKELANGKAGGFLECHPVTKSMLPMIQLKRADDEIKKYMEHRDFSTKPGIVKHFGKTVSSCVKSIASKLKSVSKSSRSKYVLKASEEDSETLNVPVVLTKKVSSCVKSIASKPKSVSKSSRSKYVLKASEKDSETLNVPVVLTKKVSSCVKSIASKPKSVSKSSRSKYVLKASEKDSETLNVPVVLTKKVSSCVKSIASKPKSVTKSSRSKYVLKASEKDSETLNVPVVLTKKGVCSSSSVKRKASSVSASTTKRAKTTDTVKRRNPSIRKAPLKSAKTAAGRLKRVQSRRLLPINGYQKKIGTKGRALTVLYEGSMETEETLAEPQRQPLYIEHLSNDQADSVQLQVEQYKKGKESVSTQTEPVIVLEYDKDIHDFEKNKKWLEVLEIVRAIERKMEVNICLPEQPGCSTPSIEKNVPTSASNVGSTPPVKTIDSAVSSAEKSVESLINQGLAPQVNLQAAGTATVNLPTQEAVFEYNQMNYLDLMNQSSMPSDIEPERPHIVKKSSVCSTPDSDHSKVPFFTAQPLAVYLHSKQAEKSMESSPTRDSIWLPNSAPAVHVDSLLGSFEEQSPLPSKLAPAQPPHMYGQEGHVDSPSGHSLSQQYSYLPAISTHMQPPMMCQQDVAVLPSNPASTVQVSTVGHNVAKQSPILPLLSQPRQMYTPEVYIASSYGQSVEQQHTSLNSTRRSLQMFSPNLDSVSLTSPAPVIHTGVVSSNGQSLEQQHSHSPSVLTQRQPLHTSSVVNRSFIEISSPDDISSIHPGVNLKLQENTNNTLLLKFSHSPSLFAWKLAQTLFAEEQLTERNFYGRGKPGLSPRRRRLIEETVFQHFPKSESMKMAVDGINAGIRGIRRKKLTNLSKLL